MQKTGPAYQRVFTAHSSNLTIVAIFSWYTTDAVKIRLDTRLTRYIKLGGTREEAIVSSYTSTRQERLD